MSFRRPTVAPSILDTELPGNHPAFGRKHRGRKWGDHGPQCRRKLKSGGKGTIGSHSGIPWRLSLTLINIIVAASVCCLVLLCGALFDVAPVAKFLRDSWTPVVCGCVSCFSASPLHTARVDGCGKEGLRQSKKHDKLIHSEIGLPDKLKRLLREPSVIKIQKNEFGLLAKLKSPPRESGE